MAKLEFLRDVNGYSVYLICMKVQKVNLKENDHHKFLKLFPLINLLIVNILIRHKSRILSSVDFPDMKMNYFLKTCFGSMRATKEQKNLRMFLLSFVAFRFFFSFIIYLTIVLITCDRKKSINFLAMLKKWHNTKKFSKDAKIISVIIKYLIILSALCINT